MLKLLPMMGEFGISLFRGFFGVGADIYAFFVSLSYCIYYILWSKLRNIDSFYEERGPTATVSLLYSLYPTAFAMTNLSSPFYLH